MRFVPYVQITALAFATLSCQPAQHSGTAVKRAGKPVPQEALVGWALVQSSVLDQCLDCHAGRQTPNLTNNSEVIQSFPKILDEISQNTMPPPNQNYVPLSECQKAILKKWSDV